MPRPPSPGEEVGGVGEGSRWEGVGRREGEGGRKTRGGGGMRRRWRKGVGGEGLETDRKGMENIKGERMKSLQGAR